MAPVAAGAPFQPLARAAAGPASRSLRDRLTPPGNLRPDLRPFGGVADSTPKGIAGRLGRLGARVLTLGHTTPQWKDLPPQQKPTPPETDARKAERP